MLIIKKGRVEPTNVFHFNCIFVSFEYLKFLYLKKYNYTQKKKVVIFLRFIVNRYSVLQNKKVYLINK